MENLRRFISPCRPTICITFLCPIGDRRSIDCPRGWAALCISGGGIRSAISGLGLLQGLAQQGIRGKCDFLSTVSGGGHIGSWLTAWIKRNPQGVGGVRQKLAVAPRDALTGEPEPVGWLRQHSNYLSPKLRLVSADFWTLIGTYLRNLLRNWLLRLTRTAH
jgi:hypothetical protein